MEAAHAAVRWARVLLALVTLFAAFPQMAAEAASRGCGSRGGPGYRAPNGKCVGWAELARLCGRPPETLCVKEGGRTTVDPPEPAEVETNESRAKAVRQ